jgi:hypothetical protein
MTVRDGGGHDVDRDVAAMLFAMLSAMMAEM